MLVINYILSKKRPPVNLENEEVVKRVGLGFSTPATHWRLWLTGGVELSIAFN
jgi:hypothetical protein